MNKMGKIMVVVAVIGIVGFAATSFAGWGRGWGGGGSCWDQGGRWGQRASKAPGYQGNLSDQDIDNLNHQRQAFFEDSRELREKLYQKELELRGEMSKPEPDAGKAVALQKEVSELKGQLDLKRIEQRIKMKKENPDFFAGRGYGMGRGYGKGSRGFGGRGGGCRY
jgi:Spy/CpxP family protein refolding chaperone